MQFVGENLRGCLEAWRVHFPEARCGGQYQIWSLERHASIAGCRLLPEPVRLSEVILGYDGTYRRSFHGNIAGRNLRLPLWKGGELPCPPSRLLTFQLLREVFHIFIQPLLKPRVPNQWVQIKTEPLQILG